MNKTLRFGLTEIEIRPRKTVIYHGGNMGNTIDRSVRPNVDHLLGENMFDALRAVGVEDGHPSYIYTLTLSTKAYREVVGA